jgi:3-hydroxyacyl-[acyl-carrier-protein] dehydratase
LRPIRHVPTFAIPWSTGILGTLGPSMRFVLIDRITELQRGESLVAVKNLSLAEEYLADHFPGFPVMPGVLMLEALTQAGAWLIRDMEDFAHSVIVLKQAKTIKYGSFVEPGRQLQLRVNLVTHGETETTFKGVGVIDGQEMVKGRITLTRYNLRDRSPSLHATDTLITSGLRDLFATLRKGSVGARAMLREPSATGAEAVLASPKV